MVFKGLIAYTQEFFLVAFLSKREEKQRVKKAINPK